MPSFVDPGVLVTQPMLDQIRSNVERGAEPTRSSFLRARDGTTPPYGSLPAVRLGSLAYVPHPQILRADGTGIDEFREDAFAAYTHALLWAATGDSRHVDKARSILDGWARVATPPPPLSFGLQVAWAGAVWPRAAEIVRHAAGAGPWAGAAAFGSMLNRVVVPLVDEGASTNGNIGLVMTEAALATAVYNDDAVLFNSSLARFRAQAAAYLYVSTDGPLPRRPPAQRYLAKTAPVCDPTCSDAELVKYWHGQAEFEGHDGISQESCRDLAHAQLGMASLAYVAETAYHQGVDLYAELQPRLVAGAELHASLLAWERRPPWLCGGALRAANASTFDVVHRHYATRRGVALPNVSASLRRRGDDRDRCWDQPCWETFTHGDAFS